MTNLNFKNNKKTIHKIPIKEAKINRQINQRNRKIFKTCNNDN